jgi:hypothetical protein
MKEKGGEGKGKEEQTSSETKLRLKKNFTCTRVVPRPLF